ncbi:RagB/SusD family nutrient uptake outer membrane protein [Parabacteroides sp. AM58-2XD]|jgi:starch-binding outer membrane protein, SusD/RagB family|uniref:RagB/SusD family nutrient uptake outer membrane protein n=1 Tax=Parabacteroides segnis TaxID=2763058 RepID=A0ABR7DZH0_9BACT|nr:MULTISPECIES: RagB/SusD family nutrient uptake outer membrane protein [Parabacteroides]MBC5642920.1 RagB/SusD family nutrient uptake outer membrane protein [Parabacteroides segnis]MCM0713071.1 RagB/SusD family nutrient uptake outer membrane protein [Parabacteroides sp. TA-V-105]RGY94698.1 RagB/SusD family nutrient uptake outer membrane protein [Parabacteroides sp. AM58-2XD]
MKLINKYIGFLLLSGTLFSTSCSDSFLQRDSLTDTSNETFWQTTDDALMGLTACYAGLQDNQLYNSDQYSLGPLYMDCITDNGGHFNWSGWIEGFDVAMGVHSPSSGIFSAYWSSCYEVINRCNSLLANIDQIDMAAETKAVYKAEAMTLRALIYCNLTSLYRDVPYITAPQSITDAQCEKTDRATIVSGIMNDLKEAISVLPATADLGRITKGAAQALLGRIALYNEKWEDAISAYKGVMEMNYSLYDDYSTLFTTAGENSSEIIWSVRYEGPGLSEGAAYNGHWNTPLEALNGTVDLADAFYCTNGKPTTDKKIGEPNVDGSTDVNKPNAARYNDRDPRLYATLFVPGMLWNGKGGEGNWYGGASASYSTVYVYKYFNPSDVSNSFDNGQDFYLIRYSEVLLSLAEALVQKGGYSFSEVTGLINQVRRRVDMPTVESVEGTGLSQFELLEVIKHERRVELAFEGLRLFDLYRWKELDKAVKNIENERVANGFNYEKRIFNGERDYVWPIPTSELDTNKKLVQNDLWK